MKPGDAPARDWKALLLRHEMILLYVLIAEWLFFYFAGTSVNRRGVVIGFGTLDRQFDVLRHSRLRRMLRRWCVTTKALCRRAM